MRSRLFMALAGAILVFLWPQVGWGFTDDQTITVNMGWFQLKKLDMSQFNLLEAQLGGVKLGDTIYNYLGHRDGHAAWTGVAKYYGNPTGLVVGGAAAQPAVPPPTGPMPAGAPMGPGAAPSAAPPGAGAGMAAPGAAGGVGAALGAAAGMARGAATAGYQLPPLVLPSAAGLGAAAFQPPGGMGMPGAGMAGPGMTGAPGVTAVTAAPAARERAGGPEGLLANDEEKEPYWALPVWFALQSGEVEYVYHKTPDLVIGVVVDEVGIITAVAVAGAPTSFAKTSLGRAHRFVRLGDLFKMILYRYGYPDKIQTFDSGGGEGRVVTFQETTNQFDNDCILWFDEETEGGLRKNIAFTCHNMKVTRIHIWIPQEE